MAMTVIQLDNVGLRFRVRRFGRISLKEYLLQGLFRRSKKATFEVQALENVNLTVGEGDRLGIIGPNGAGKSTLLKLLAGIYPPTSGRRKVVGQVSALFDIAPGVRARRQRLGKHHVPRLPPGRDAALDPRKMQPIAEFSELGDFLNMSVRYYSTGMMVRLAFSIATAIEPEILIVDEVLSAGDLAFQAKARARMQALIKSARAVIVVSHDLSSLELMCDRVLWLDHGHVRQIGPAKQVIAAYAQEVNGAAQRQAA